MMTGWKSLKYLIPVICSLCSGCFQSDYTRLVKSELAKNTRQDSLLLGLYFGDTRNTYFGKCFDLNKQKLIVPGPGNSSVQYRFTDSLFHKTPTDVRLLFRPTFDKNDKISEMVMEFSYPAWAPWNRQFQSDSLEQKVLKVLMRWYKGNEFVEAHINDGELPVKVDGNRRMMVYIKDPESVIVKIQDIMHPDFMHSISQKKN